MKSLLVPAILLVALLLGILALWMAHEEWEEYEHHADWRVPELAPGAGAPGSGLLSLDQVVERLRFPEGTRVLEVEREEERDRLVYEIEYLTPEGHYRELRVDPRTAEILGMEDEEEEESHETAAGGR